MASGVDTGAPGERHAQDTEVVSVDLPAPPGWGKKYTPRKDGTLKRNEIAFTSPTGEQITNKRKLEQYLRSHPGGLHPSEFDWGIGDTPRRSSRLRVKPKVTEISKVEKTKKVQKKSISKKSLNDKTKDTKSEAPEEAKDAAATKESAELEMADAEGHAEKKKESAAATVEQRPTEKKSEGKEGPEEAASLPDAGKNAKEVEGKENSNNLHPVSEEGKGNALKKTEEKNSEDSVVLPRTPDAHKEEVPAEKDAKEEEGAAATVEQGATDRKSKDDTMVLQSGEKNGNGNKEHPEESVVQIQTSEDQKEAVTAAKDGVNVLSKNDGLVQGSTVY